MNLSGQILEVALQEGEAAKRALAAAQAALAAALAAPPDAPEPEQPRLDEVKTLLSSLQCSSSEMP